MSAANVYKVSPTFDGQLTAWKRGDEVQWTAPMCVECNGRRSQPFDRSYDRLSSWIHTNIATVGRTKSLDWAVILGSGWRDEAASVSRYLAKQLGCLLAENGQKPAPEILGFLDGDHRPGSLGFSAWIDRPTWTAMHGGASGVPSGHIGLPAAKGGRDPKSGAIVWVDYVLMREFVCFQAKWSTGAILDSVWEYPGTRLPLDTYQPPLSP